MSVVGGAVRAGRVLERLLGTGVKATRSIGRAASRGADIEAAAERGFRLVGGRLLQQTGRAVRGLEGVEPAQASRIGRGLLVIQNLSRAERARLIPKGVRLQTADDIIKYLESGGLRDIERLPESVVMDALYRSSVGRAERVGVRQASEAAAPELADVSQADRYVQGLTAQQNTRSTYARTLGASARARRKAESASRDAEGLAPDQKEWGRFTTAAAGEGGTVSNAVPDLRGVVASVGRLPLRRIMRGMSKENADIKAFLDSGAKITGTEVVGKGVVRVRGVGGRTVEVDLASEAARATPGGARFHRELSKVLERGKRPGIGLPEVLDAGALPVDETALTGFLRRSRKRPALAALAAYDTFALTDFVGEKLDNVGAGALSDMDVGEQQRAAVMDVLRQARYTQTMAANEARLAAIEPDLYNGMLAGRRVSAGSRVYGAPKRTDEMMQILDAMSMGKFQQSLGSLNLGY